MLYNPSNKRMAFFDFVKPYWFYFLLSVIAALISSSVILSLGMYIKHFVDADVLNLTSLFMTFGSAIIILNIAIYFRIYFIVCAGEKVVFDITNAMYQHIMHMSLSFFESTIKKKLFAIISEDTDRLRVSISTTIPIALRNIITVIGGVCMLFYTAPKLLLWLLFLLAIMLPIIIKVLRRVKSLSRENHSLFLDLSTFVDEILNRMKVIQVFNIEDIILGDLYKKSNKALSHSLRCSKYRALLVISVITSILLATIFVLWIGLTQIKSGYMLIGDLIAFIFYIFLVFSSLSGLSDVVSLLYSLQESVLRMMHFLHQTPEIMNKNVDVIKVDAVDSIRFDNVSFSYPDRRNVLNNLCFELTKGMKAAIVGLSGAGKSTIIKLLLRLYDVSSGAIFINDIDIREMSVADLRNLFSVVFQEPMLFSDTLKNNILIGRSHASDEELDSVIQKASIANFLSSLSNGLEYYIGEQGNNLSEGQKQRVSIARALLKKCRVLCLDEATSSLDIQNEGLIHESIKDIDVDISIIIAHRLSTVRTSDIIIVIGRDGRIDSIGTHKELCSSSVLYSSLIKKLAS